MALPHDSLQYKVYQRAYQQRLRAKRRELGLCKVCGLAVEDERKGKMLCASCAEQQNRHSQNWKARQKGNRKGNEMNGKIGKIGEVQTGCPTR